MTDFKLHIGQIVTEALINNLGGETIGSIAHISKIVIGSECYHITDKDISGEKLRDGHYRVMDSYLRPTEQELMQKYYDKLRYR